MNVSFHRWLAGAGLWLLAVLVFPAAAQAQAMCGIPGNDGGGTVGGVVNTYYAGTGTLPAGATQLTLGARNTGSAAGNIQAGDLLLVIQMQDGQINPANNANYGSGTGTGSGTTTMENAGRHEFVRASNGGAAGATISFQPALTYTYTQANATTSRGRRSYQVIRVPQYSSVTMAGVEAPPWDGNSGGVVAVDASGTLTLGSATVEGIANRAVFLAGRGFRGGAGFQGSQASNDLPWRQVGGTTAATTAHGGKGEGIAGTPRYLARKTNNFGLAVTTTGHLVRVDNGVQGYPQGDRARGAPGNAGGGGTEGTYSPGTAANMRNAGGGGGGNHAPGGLGGRPWDAPLNDTNGRGGAGYASQISFSRVLMGGGGGSGGNNDGTDDAAWYENNGIACGTSSGDGASGSTFGAGICSSGGSGGGIVILRARSIEGTGVIDVRGGHGYNVRNDAAGGGGGGGSVVLYTQEGGQATVDASGGDGGNAWAGSNAGPVERHGPGGGGGGGFVVFSPNSMTVNANVDGGQPGRSTNGATDTYGSFGHNGGIATFMAPDTPGVPPGAQCEPDLRLSKDNGIDVLLTSGSTTYTLSVSNTSVVPTTGPITVVDVLPPQLTVADGPVPLAGPQAGDWSCLAASDVLTCTSNTVIPAGGTSTFNFTAIVDAPSGTAIINRGRVGGGGDPNKPIPTPGNTGACIDNDVAPGCAIDIDIVEAPFLGLTKANAGALLAGGSGQYTLTLTNLGSAPTSDPIRIVDVLPDGVSFDSGFTTTGGFSCSHAAGVVECNSSAVLAVGASATISFTITVDADAPTSVTNRAIAGGGGDPAKPGLPDAGDAQVCPAPVSPADNASSMLTGCASVTDPVRRVQLTLEKTDHQNSMPVNGQTTYHFTVRNSGDADSVGTIHFRDELPAPMTWSNPLVKGGADGADWTCVREDNDSATCQSTAVIPVGGSSTFSLVANVNGANPSLQYINKGRIGGGGDPDLLPGMPTPGQVGTGCTGINVGPGCALDINVPVAQPQIRLAKSHPDPQAANPGDTITFNLVVSNSGGNATSGQIRVVDVIPPGMTYVGSNSFNSGGFSCNFTATPAPGYLTCNRNTSLAAGASTTISYTAQVAADASNPLVNRAQVGGGGDPGLPGATGITPATAQECSAHMAPHLGCAIDPVPLNADLQIGKSQRPGTSGPFQPGPLTVFHGDTVQFSIVIGNNGPATVTGATFSDIIPAQFSTLSIVSADGSTSPACTLGSYGLSGNTLSGTVTTIAPGGSCTLVVEGTASTLGVGITNTATVAVPPGVNDTDPGNNSSSTQTDIVAMVPALEITKTSPDTLLIPGGSASYTVTVANTGNIPLSNVIVTDPVPAGLTGFTWTCTASSGATCPAASGTGALNETLASLPVGGQVTWAISAQVESTPPNPVENTANASADETCTTPCPATVTVPTSTAPAVAKQFVPDSIGAGGSSTLTITLTNANAGPATLTSDLIDTLPAGVTLTGAPVTTCVGTVAGTAGGSAITLQTGAQIPGGTPGSCSITAPVTGDTPGTFTNTIPAGGLVTDLGSNLLPAEDDLTVTATPPTVAKAFAPDTIDNGGTSTLTITLGNANTVAAVLTADLVDNLPAGVTLASVPTSSCTGTVAGSIGGSTITLASGSTIPAGGCTITADVTSSTPGTFTNTIPAGGLQTDLGDNPDPAEDDLTVLDLPQVSVAKSANPASGSDVLPGQGIQYQVTVTVTDAPLSADFGFQDSLGAGLTFDSLVSAPGFNCTGTLACVLPAGTPVGSYIVTYTATVDADASGSVGNQVVITANGGDPDPVCTVCSTEHPISAPEVTVAKSANPADGTEVTAGQTLTYTLSVTVADAATTSDVVLTDVLGAGLSFGSIVSSDFDSDDVSGAPSLVFTLDAGAIPGTYTVSYTATVDNDATVSVGNAVTAIGGGGPGDPDPSCTTCSTEHPISAPEITVAKSANPADGTEVTAGQTLTYTLTVTVADAATTSDVVLTDVLGAGLTFAGVTSAGDFTPDVSGAPTLVFTLPAGTMPGIHEVSYTATVDNDATVSVGNAVSAIGGGGPGDPDPSCTTCSTDHPISAPEVTVAKSANPADGTEVTAGQTLTYTLTVTVADAATTTDVVLTDVLGAGLTFAGVTSAGDFTADTSSAPTLVFTLPAGATPGPYTVSYQATVDNDATVSVGNAVTAIGGGGPGDPDPVCTTCSTDHPISAPEITVAKSADPADGTEVTAGQTLTYTLSVTVADAATTTDVVLTDVLGAGLTFAGVTSAGDFTPDVSGAPTLVFTLPAGTTPGIHEVSYTATVDNDATVSVGNAVTAIGGGGPGDPDPVCTTCETEHPITDPAVSFSKSADPADGTAVTVGETLTYTLTVEVENSATLSDVVLTDVLGAGLTFGSIVSSDFDSDDVSGAPSLVFTLDAGAIPGTYTVVYEVTVDNDATVSVNNTVTATGGGDPGNPGAPDPVCDGNCSTEHPITDPAVSFSKIADPADGTAVAAGETLTYTLTVEVENSATLSDVVLTDVLGAGLSFGSIVSSDFDSDDVSGAPSLVFTLDAGAIPGTYTVVYEATVDTDATVSVNNTVTATGGGDPGNPGAPDPVCDGACETEHPITDPAVSFSKSANPADGTAVAAGETLTYTLTVEVENSATLSDVVLTDVLGAGLSFGSIVSSDFDSDDVSGAPSLVFTLDAGAIPGTYTVVYTATVDTDATVSVNNTVTATGGGDPGNPGAPDPVCDGDCSTEHPITDPAVSFSKSADPADGTAVAAGETLTYTLTVDVEDSATLSDVVLTDVLGAGLSFGSIVSSDFDSDDVSGAPSLVFTLDAGAIPGTYTVVYTATVDNDATVSVNNTVTAIGGGDPGNPGAPDPVCDGDCETGHPLSPAVTISKALTSEDGDLDGVAEPGETLEYTITLANTGGLEAIGFQVTDLLDDHTVFQSASHGGSHDGAAAGGLVDWTVTVPAHDGTDPGTIELTVTVQVVDDIPQDVTAITNLAYETGTTPPVCPPAGPACVVTPTAPDLVVTKTVSAHSIDDDGVAEPGEQLTYTITLVNHGGVAAIDTIVNEMVPEHTTFVGGAPIWTCASGDPAGTPCDNLIDVPASAGAGSPGQVTLTFIVEVDDPLADDVQAIRNAVVINDGTPPDCELDPGNPACAVTPTINVDLRKAVAAVEATGPASWRVSYDIEVVNLGGSPAQYTLVDTLGYADGVVFTGSGEVSTAGGLLNPALAGGHFTPANGTPVQLSAADVLLPVGVGHVYTVTVPIGVQPGLLVDGQCATGPGHGLYNLATVSGSFDLDASACADVGADVPLIRLVKTVELGVDHNGNQYGDVGDVLHYEFVITNPGTVPLTAVQLVDPRVSDLQCQRTTANGQPFYVFRGDEVFDDAFEGVPRGGILDPGDSISCLATHTLSQADVDRGRVVNTATAIGSTAAGQAVSSVSTAIYTALR